MECIVIGLIIGCILGVLSGIGQLVRQNEDEEIRRLTLKQLRDKENGR
jgi:hypothetical protein